MSGKDDVRAWMAERPGLVGMLALMAVAAANDFAFALRLMRNRHKLPGAARRRFATDQWLLMYRRHNRVWDKIMTASGLAESGECSATGIARQWRELSRRAKEEPKEVESEIRAMLTDISPEKLRELVGEARDGYRKSVDLAIEEAAGTVEDDDDETMEALMGSVEGHFFIRVCGPCWLEYGVFPAELMLEARRGDIDAIDKLLRLDKAALFDPVIREHIMAAVYADSSGRYARICKAIAGRPPGAMTRKLVKCGLAGFISVVAERLGQPLTAPEIAGLFDAVARSRGLTADPDLPAPEAFAKAIQRQRKVRRFGELDPDKS